MLSRELAHRNHYPAIDVLQSVSRLADEITTPEPCAPRPARCARRSPLYRAKEDLITIGAYSSAPTPASTTRSRSCRRSTRSCARADEAADAAETDLRLLELMADRASARAQIADPPADRYFICVTWRRLRGTHNRLLEA